MRYRVIFNMPHGEKTVLFIDEKRIRPLMEAVNKKQTVEIDEEFYNTAYFVKAEKEKTQITAVDTKALIATREKYREPMTDIGKLAPIKKHSTMKP